MEDWFGSSGMNGIVDIVSSELDKMDKAHIEKVETDITDILNLIKEDRPDVVLKYIHYLKETITDKNNNTLNNILKENQ